MSKSESRGCSTSSAVDQDVCIVVISNVKMLKLIVENVTETEADALRWIIEQQANEIVELQNKIRVLEQDLHMQSPSCKEGILTQHTAK